MAPVSCFVSIAFFLIHSSCGEPRPRPLVWSSTAYGSDGPWQAVEIQVGTPPQNLNLYPGGIYESLILSSSVCNESTECFAETAGVYTRSKSTSSIAVTAIGYLFNQSFVGTQNLTGSGSYTFDQILVTSPAGYDTATVPSFDMFVVDQAFSTRADGTRYPAQVGNLALGSSDANQTFGPFNGTLITSYLYANGDTPSNSYGLHIGSAELAIPGSLYLGGYDQLRVMGPVSSQAYGTDQLLEIDLLDIGIGVAEGGSPFPYNSKSGLLAQGNSTIKGFIQVETDPKEPYLYLPESTCDAIASELPVTFQPKYGLYFWNTADPRYQEIVTSPSYLAFTFRGNNSVTQTFTVNVPFALLNLTLSPPIIDTPTPYFPCSRPRLPDYRLGRAFLQAAFVGMNWGTDFQGSWFLAQAPGPNIGEAPSVKTIEPTDTFILASPNDWVSSWTRTWTPLPSTSGSPSGPTSPSATNNGGSTKPLSTGTIAGIAIGLIIVLVLAGVGAWMLVKRRRRAAAGPENNRASGNKNAAAGELDGLPLHVGRNIHELPPKLDRENGHVELPG